MASPWHPMWSEVIGFECSTGAAFAYYSPSTGELGIATVDNDSNNCVFTELARELVVFGFGSLQHGYVADDGCHYFLLLNKSKSDYVLACFDEHQQSIDFVSSVESLLPLTEGVVGVSLGATSAGLVLCVSSFHAQRLYNVSFPEEQAGTVRLEEVSVREGPYTHGALVTSDLTTYVVAVKAAGELVVYPVGEFGGASFDTEVFHTPASCVFHISCHSASSADTAAQPFLSYTKTDEDSVPKPSAQQLLSPWGLPRVSRVHCAESFESRRTSPEVLQERRVSLRKARYARTTAGCCREPLPGGAEVCLSNQGLLDCDVEAIVPELKSRRSLRDLDLSYNLLTDASVLLLARLVEHSCRLMSLDLRGNLLTQHGAVHLLASLRINRRVRCVLIDDNDIEPSVLQKVSEITGNDLPGIHHTNERLQVA
eukprot:TRINITY_DN60451_c0_g1_i1.p1 TRINITY_DN60451_c0_g1~~TRINITY_DN60451_c0_g1_i1.p1  ORF type:complete len:456 (+),score=80.39 TRINITY_DN60451_c0_g1_i1:91-1368(+)